jgi:2-deoxy-D-gluconate 3-dehydrogenase
LARAGADVAIASRGFEDLEAVKEQIEVETGRRCLPIEVDVRNLTSIQSMVDEVDVTFGRIDILVNNAGINIPRPVLEVTEEEWDDVLDTNLKGLFFCSQAVGRVMLREGGGSIVNVASTMGLVAMPDRAAYCSSKGGVVLVTKVMALAWATEGIRVNAIAPTFVVTAMTSAMLEEPDFMENVMEKIPMRRVGEVGEVAQALIFLASPASSFVTGVVLPVDGGYLAN